MQSKPAYVSLFSSGGLGCYGFKEAGFDCVATAELLDRRMSVQRANKVCIDDNGYIVGDLTSVDVHARILSQVALFKYKNPGDEISAVIATPPCQGMSVANHKKKPDEIIRNSLVLESIRLVREINPRFFVFENVRSFLNSACSEDGINEITIEEAIYTKLGGTYLIAHEILNLKDYGSPSSRTRTLVIGVRKDLAPLVPTDFFPEKKLASSLKKLIGHLPSLLEMGEVSSSDHLHAFRPYSPEMRTWIENLLPGQSAFDQTDPARRPHRIVKGVRQENKASNGDKYRRSSWEQIPPCVHTRNDILSSQSTVHPVDDRVFSIRELMLFMGVPSTFVWSDEETVTDPENWSPEQRREFLKKNDTNIRQCLGEGVPTPVFRSIGEKIMSVHRGEEYPPKDYEKKILDYEHTNPNRRANDAFFTSKVAAFALGSRLPDFKKKKIKVLEPSVGAGSLLPELLRKYRNKKIELTIIDIDNEAVDIALEVIKQCDHHDISVRSISDDFFNVSDQIGKFDLIISNPPFSATKGRVQTAGASGSRKLFARFLESCMEISTHVSFIIPKSFLNSPDYWKLRTMVARNHVRSIFDFGTKGFDGILVETIGLHVSPPEQQRRTWVESLIVPVSRLVDQKYIIDAEFPTWLIYRDNFFDQIISKIDLGIFEVYRDRKITSKNSLPLGDYPVLKARDIGETTIEPHSPTHFVNEDTVPEQWKKLRNRTDLVAVPNLTYYPRAAFVPNGVVPDGSAAVLVPITDREVSDEQLKWYSSEAFYYFYRIARNYAVRSLNVDKCSVFYWGLPKKNQSFSSVKLEKSSGKLFALPDSEVALGN